MAITGLIISILAFGLSLFTYIKHDSKIKRQTALINEYKIAKIKDDQEISIKAIIEGNLLKGNKGRNTLNVHNKGKSVAIDVIVKIPETSGLMIFSNPTPIEIRPQQSIDIDFQVTKAAPEFLTIEFYWKDEFSHDNNYTQTFPL